MAFDAYLELEGLEGESETTGFEGQIEIYSFSFGASNPASITTSGMATGKATVSSFNIMKTTDTTSPEIFQQCMQGVHWPTATVTLLKSGGEASLPFLVFEFKELYCSTINWSGGSGGDDRPMESISFDFSAVKVTYSQQDEKGAAAKQPTGAWDLRTQTKNF
ncbi:MAG: type VI secretion system tube protein Hcp [Gemmatimonadetes bacterium]|nr:type VI secretion system tube protein Hcp [Gemmatimonadota bacterium]